MRVTARLLAPCLLFAATLLAGCGPAATGPGQQAAVATATPSATALPPDAPIPEAFRGVWTTQLDTGGQSHGAWKLRITADELELHNPVAPSEDEYFQLHARAATQEGVSFYDDPPENCPGTSYRWTLDGDTLTLTPVDRDPCPDRWDTLATKAWHRIP
jgi:hypothetical protein